MRETTFTDGPEALFALGLPLPTSALADLHAYRDLLSTWNGRMNLVGPSAMAEFWTRHVADSAQLLSLAPGARTFADLGSGAGLPGLVLAILLKGVSGARVHLVESLAKRCAFLTEAVSVLALPAIVHHARAEALRPAPVVDVVTARAVAPLDKLLAFARPVLKPGVRGLFLKGRSAAAEIEAARQGWSFTATLHPSRTDPEGRIVEITRLQKGGLARG